MDLAADLEECWRFVLWRPFPRPDRPPRSLWDQATWDIQAQEDARVFAMLDALGGEPPPPPPTRFERISG